MTIMRGRYYGSDLAIASATADPGVDEPSLRLTRNSTRVQANPKSLAVSVLDLVAMRAGESAGSAIARSLDLARRVENLGYRRYWVAEHHSIPGLACSATPVLVGHIA